MSLKLFRRPLVTASAVALLALGSIGIAHAISSNIFQYTTPQTGYLNLSPMAFSPEDAADAAHFAISPPFWISKDAGANNVCMVAGVHLPEGARVKSLTAWAASDVDQGVQVRLMRANPASGTANGLVGVISHDTSQNRFAMSAAAPGATAVINNQHFGYGVHVCINSTPSLFFGARITYTYSDAGD